MKLTNVLGVNSISNYITKMQKKNWMQKPSTGIKIKNSAVSLMLSEGAKILLKSSKKPADVNAPREPKADDNEDLLKALEIARRIMHGNIVPKRDEDFLLEFDPKLFLKAKLMAMQNDDPEEYDSLLEDEEDSDVENFVEGETAPPSDSGETPTAETATAEEV
ncbi:hypothetical protein AGMMS49938_01030 [Fibrobacterales bacterium]|nr:hypothetical protein AGMMS49938_01030 [Fibrobacterales bacterium]